MRWVTQTIDPVVDSAMITLIKLVDRVRMLDNDMIRLNTKLSMVIEYRYKLDPQHEEELDKLVNKYRSTSK